MSLVLSIAIYLLLLKNSEISPRRILLSGKAKNRWYIPDPRRAGDLEKLREKALLKEFHLIAESKKRIKEFRIEAVRAGFKKCWDEGDHKTILEVAKCSPRMSLRKTAICLCTPT